MRVACRLLFCLFASPQVGQQLRSTFPSVRVTVGDEDAPLVFLVHRDGTFAPGQQQVAVSSQSRLPARQTLPHCSWDLIATWRVRLICALSHLFVYRPSILPALRTRVETKVPCRKGDSKEQCGFWAGEGLPSRATSTLQKHVEGPHESIHLLPAIVRTPPLEEGSPWRRPKWLCGAWGGDSRTHVRRSI